MPPSLSTGVLSNGLQVFAPAKINLYLHVVKRLPNGYHALDSLISFADIGDQISITPSSDFQFSVSGPFADGLKGRDLDSGPQSSNLVVKAVWRLARLIERAPNVSVHLTKNLPLGAGIGGGSSDAAAVIWGLCSLWHIPTDADFIPAFLTSLGADVPVCFAAKDMRIRGIGDIMEAAPNLPEIPIVLVFPGKPCSTVDIFRHYTGAGKEFIALPERFADFYALTDFLNRTENDLSAAATALVPDIENVLRQIGGQAGCVISRMSGSGSCCFGLFENVQDAEHAAITLAQENPDWWVKSGWLGRVTRY